MPSRIQEIPSRHRVSQAGGTSDPNLPRAADSRSVSGTETPPAGTGGSLLLEARRRRLARDLFLQGLKQALCSDTPADALPLPSLLGRHLAAITDAAFNERMDAMPHGA